MKRAIKRILLLCMIVFINVFFVSVKYQDNINAELMLQIQSDQNIDIQIFTSENGEFVETQSQRIQYEAGDTQRLTFEVPRETKYIRLDLGDRVGEIEISELNIGKNTVEINLLRENGDISVSSNMLQYSSDENGMHVLCNGNDPYIVYDISAVNLSELMASFAKSENMRNKIALCMAFDLIIIFCYLQRRKIWSFVLEVIGNKGLLIDLAKNDFKTKYAGSYLGIIWAFVQPIVTILVYWFVFQMGFKSGTVDGIPFVLWLTAGLVPWFFFNEALNSATASLLDYSYLVKKVVFNVGIIPPVRIMSSLFVHVFFCLFMIVMYLLNGILPCLQWLQLLYYSSCLVLLVVGITYLTSALVVFFRDLSQIIIVILQIGMWMTPIMWNKDMLQGNWQLIYKLNPFYYIVQGYRDALIYHKWFWDSEFETIFFWVFTGCCLCIGSKVFSKLKIHFADVI